MGIVAIADRLSIPHKIYARWFSFRTQTFYEINLSLPEDLEQRAIQWYQQYPEHDYLHTLEVGFSGKGEMRIWWEAFCLACDNDRSHDFHTAIIEGAKAHVVDGEPGHYQVRTQEYIDDGTIPSPWTNASGSTP